MGNLATFEFDIIETKEGPFGFVEGRSRIHKTATSEERKTLYMPFVAPIYWGYAPSRGEPFGRSWHVDPSQALWSPLQSYEA